MKQRRGDSEGYIVLITVLIIGIAATTIALFLLITGTDASLASAGVEADAQARAGALSCTELALGSIQSDTALATPTTDSYTLDSTIQQSCTYDISGSSPNYTISATGTVRASTDNVIHRMMVVTDQVTPQLRISSWKDIP
ncbi:MAG TPA: hypothetical protein VJC09_02460 [Candidatus Saccharimonadales bacterium]|nr:hypothetical protein [Candidatus Saccharimonadales bacterium]